MEWGSNEVDRLTGVGPFRLKGRLKRVNSPRISEIEGVKQKQIRATYDQHTITVYQAYSKVIADGAVEHQRFVPPFSFQRMTWIKPSFLWMMERSGWATKPNQERILSIQISRSGWEQALANAVLTAPSADQGSEEWRQQIKVAPTRVQWDPERTLRGGKSEQRSIQLGIGRQWSEKYATEWIQSITDITPLVHKIAQKRKDGHWKQASELLPQERVYPLPEEIERRLVGEG